MLLRGVLVSHFWPLLRPGDVNVSPAYRSLVAFVLGLLLVPVFSWRIVISIFNIGESCMFPASPGAAQER